MATSDRICIVLTKLVSMQFVLVIHYKHANYCNRSHNSNVDSELEKSFISNHSRGFVTFLRVTPRIERLTDTLHD